MAGDPFKAREYGEHVTATTGQTINASDFVAQPYVGSSEKVRNLPIDPKLESLLAQIANETGVTFVVSSGGQTEAGRKKLGSSVRHNDGMAGDVMIKDANGNFVDFTTPEGQQTWSRVISLARAGGATGIGAGVGYMGTKTVHIGYGNPAVWSSTKSGVAVEPWLKAAYDAGKTLPPMNIPVVASQLSTTPARSPTIDKSTQDALRQAGFNPGKSDGINGLKTQAAIKAFQSANGLKVDGIVGKNTLAALQRATAASQSAPSPLPSRGVAVAHPSAAQPIVPSGPQGRSSRGRTAAPQSSNGFAGLMNAGRALGSTLTTLGTAAGSIANAVNPRAQPTPPRVPSAPRRSTAMPSVAPQGPQGRGRPSNAFLRPYGTPGMSTITVNGGRVTYAPPAPRAVPAAVAAARAAEVQRESNIPGVERFTGTVQQGEGGQNRYGSTAHNELLAIYGSPNGFVNGSGQAGDFGSTLDRFGMIT